MKIDIKVLAEIISALLVVGSVLFAVFKWILNQNAQDEAIEHIKKENSLICKGLFACLDGLEQLGCNHTVPLAKKELDDYIKDIAHK